MNMSTLDFYNLSLKAILKNSRNEILGLQAVNNGSLAGFFDLPGGRITVDEFHTPLTRACRITPFG
jgi:hypothetical protein